MEKPRSRIPRLIVQICSVILILLSAPQLKGQAPPAASASFDVVSLAPAGPHTRLTPLQRSGGRVTWVANRLMLVSYAFGLQPYQIRNLESDAELTVIAAETDPSATDAQVQTMFQALLAQRFHLSYHRATESGRVYSLAVAKGGPKIKPRGAGEEAAPMPDIARGRQTPAGSFGIFSAGAPYVVGRGVSIDALCGVLAQFLKTPVMDNTGLTGQFDIDLHFQSPDLEPDPQSTAPPAPSIFTALEQQLGLQLSPTTGPVSIFVVDHIDKTPTPNS